MTADAHRATSKATPGHSARPAVETLSPSPTAPEQPDSRDPEDFPPPDLCSCRRLEDRWPRSPVLIVPNAHRLASLTVHPFTVRLPSFSELLLPPEQTSPAGKPWLLPPGAAQVQHLFGATKPDDGSLALGLLCHFRAWSQSHGQRPPAGVNPVAKPSRLVMRRLSAPQSPPHKRVLAALCPAVGWL